MALLKESVGRNNMTDVFLVTANNFPTIFKAFELISHDCGRQAGHYNYAVPGSWLGVVAEIERDLANILRDADLDFETLCIGEQDEAQILVAKYRITLADKLLQEFFEEFR